MSPTFIVAALYKFVPLYDLVSLKESLLAECKNNNILGTILLASEGINGTIAGDRDGIDRFLTHLRSDPRFADLEHKESLASVTPFLKAKVRIKKEIVTLGLPEIEPNKKVGIYVDPKDWNALINDPDVTVIDTRNSYEYELGTFKNAINPQTRSFGEFPEFAKKNLDPTRKTALFCTGGIRCEKATSYLLEQGFTRVYHLKGGILKYLETVARADSQWENKCFVFDNRQSVDHSDFE